LRAVAALPEPGNASRRLYLALHTFHSTGLEGNTLTLPETLLTVGGQSLFGGFDARVMHTPLTARSTVEARNLALLWDALDLASLAGRSQPPLDLASLGVAALVDLNSAITRGTDTPTGLRLRPVAIGHQRVLLPMPDEVPLLVQEYVDWLRSAVMDLAHAADEVDALGRQLTLACDAHTRFVFVHPFSDGNGRLARTLAGLVLQRAGLPAPMFTREARTEYMAAVAAATMEHNYAPLAQLHAEAVRRSLACQILLADGVASTRNGPLEAVLSRSGCTMHQLRAS
jgi:Fic family protein